MTSSVKHYTPRTLVSAAMRTVIIRTSTIGPPGEPTSTTIDVITGVRDGYGEGGWLAILTDVVNHRDGPLTTSAERLGFDLKVVPVDGQSEYSAAQSLLDGFSGGEPSSDEARPVVCIRDYVDTGYEVSPQWLPLLFMLNDLLTKLVYESQLPAPVPPSGVPLSSNDGGRRNKGCALPVGGHDTAVLAVIRKRYFNFLLEITRPAFAAAGVPGAW